MFHNIDHKTHCYKTFFILKLQILVLSVCPWQAYLSWAPLEGRSTNLTNKNKARLEKLARDKHSSLLQAFVIYESKKFHNIDHKAH